MWNRQNEMNYLRALAFNYCIKQTIYEIQYVKYAEKRFGEVKAVFQMVVDMQIMHANGYTKVGRFAEDVRQIF